MLSARKFKSLNNPLYCKGALEMCYSSHSKSCVDQSANYPNCITLSKKCPRMISYTACKTFPGN